MRTAARVLTDLTRYPNLLAADRGSRRPCVGPHILSLLAAGWLSLSAASAQGRIESSPDPVPGGQTVKARLKLDSPVTADSKFSIDLGGSDSAMARESVVVPAGQRTADFQIKTGGVAERTFVTVTATNEDHSIAITHKMRLLPAVIQSLTLNKSLVVGGTPGSSITGTVTLLGAAPPSGLTVALEADCDNCRIDLPASLLFPVGNQSATFTIQAARRYVTTQVLVRASLAGEIRSAAFTNSVLQVQSVSLSPPSVSGQQQTTISVHLNAPLDDADRRGLRFTLTCSQLMDVVINSASSTCTSSNNDPRRTLWFDVPPGQQSVSLQFRTMTSFASPTQITLRATAEGTNGGAQATLTVTP